MGIRTPDTLLAHTRFPIVLLRPARTSLRVPTAAWLMQQLYILTQRQSSDKREFPQQRSTALHARLFMQRVFLFGEFPQQRNNAVPHPTCAHSLTARATLVQQPHPHATQSTHHAARSQSPAQGAKHKARNLKRARHLHILPLHQPRTPGLFHLSRLACPAPFIAISETNSRNIQTSQSVTNFCNPQTQKPSKSLVAAHQRVVPFRFRNLKWHVEQRAHALACEHLAFRPVTENASFLDKN